METVSTSSSTESGTLRARSANAMESEALNVHTSDHPGMSLVSTPLEASNYLAWSRSIEIALTSEMKSGFIDGTCVKPANDTAEYKQWIRTDCMVISWILNSVSKDIAKAFIYTKSARHLWLELKSRFGQSNGPLMYNLQRAIASVSQDNLSVVAYFTKLKLLWDELECIYPLPECTCASRQSVVDRDASNKLMQFLMGLNDSFDHIRNQILVMEPLPTVDKAYSLVLRVESQRQVQMSSEDITNNSAMMVNNSNEFRKQMNKTFQQKKKQYTDKRSVICENCGKPGHTRDACFKLHGYPDWFKELNEQRKRGAVEIEGACDRRSLEAAAG